MNTKPINYPYGRASEIYDAGAFRFEDSTIYHLAKHYPEPHRVVSRCGVWGNTFDYMSRRVEWSNAYDDQACERCMNS